MVKQLLQEFLLIKLIRGNWILLKLMLHLIMVLMNVRAIIESANQRSLIGDYKIFIIDECHSITTQGWQAFLKELKESSVPHYFYVLLYYRATKLPVSNFKSCYKDIIFTKIMQKLLKIDLYLSN